MADLKLIRKLQVPTDNNAHLTRNGKEIANPLVRLVLEILNGLGIRTAEQVNTKNFRSVFDKDGSLQEEFQARTLSVDPEVLNAISEMSTSEIDQYLGMILAARKTSNVVFPRQEPSGLDETLSMLSSMLYASREKSVLREFKSTVIQKIIPQFIADFDAAQAGQVEEGLTGEFQGLLAKNDGSILSKFKIDRKRGNPDVRLGEKVLTTCADVNDDAKKIDAFLGVEANSELSFAAQYFASQAVPIQFMGEISGPIMMEGIQNPTGERFPNIYGRNDSVEVELIRTEGGISARFTCHTDFVLVDPTADDENKREVIGKGPTFHTTIDFTDGAFKNMQVGHSPAN